MTLFKVVLPAVGQVTLTVSIGKLTGVLTSPSLQMDPGPAQADLPA